MARQTLTKVSSPGAYTHIGNKIPFTVDIADGSQFKATGKEIVVVKNPDTAAHSVTITSSEDKFNRTKDISKSIPTGEQHVFGVFPLSGWVQSDGYIYLSDSDNTLEFAVITIKK